MKVDLAMKPGSELHGLDAARKNKHRTKISLVGLIGGLKITASENGATQDDQD